MDSGWNIWIGIAWKRACKTLGIVGPSATLLRVIIAAIAIATIWLFGSQDAWRDEILVKVIPIALVVLCLPVVFAYFCVRTPYDFEHSIRERVTKERDDLAERLSSKLKLNLRPYACRLDRGSSLVTLGGSTQTLLTNYDDVVAISCRNISSATFQFVRAYLTEARRVSDDGKVEEIPLREPIELPWKVDGVLAENGGVMLRPESPQTIFVLALRQRALMQPFRRDLNSVEVSAHNMFNGNDQFQIKVCVYADNSPPEIIWLEVRNRNLKNENADPSLVEVRELQQND